MALTLPWPDKALSPNARLHFHAKAKAVKAARESAYWLAEAAGLQCPEGDVVMRLRFYPPDNRRRDCDGMLSSCKAMIDGMCDAMQINDYRLGFWISREQPVKAGKVTVELLNGKETPR